MNKTFFQIVCFIFVLNLGVVAFGSPSLNSIPEQIENYKTCVTSLTTGASALPWINAFAACSARNDSNTATKCMAELQASDSTLSAAVVAAACAGGSVAVPVSSCMATLFQNDGLDPSITNSACSAGGSASAAELCMKDLMTPTADDPFGIDNVTAGILCSAGNTATQSLSCYKSVTTIYPLYVAQACSGGNDATWVNNCVAYGMAHLKGLAGTTGQEDRAASFACANSLLK